LLDGRSVRCKLCKQLRHGSTLIKENTGWRVHMYKYVYSAQKRKIDWELSIDQFMSLCQSDCNYCGATPVQRVMNRHTINANGIDRVDSDKGYVVGNTVPSCGLCNKMKMKLTREEFLEHIEKIYRFGIRT